MPEEYIEQYKKNQANPQDNVPNQSGQFQPELSNNRKNYNLEGSKGFNKKKKQYGVPKSNHVVLQPDTTDYTKLVKKPFINNTSTPRIKYFN